ncbi:MAG: hypothetical protein Q8N83_15050 [Ignavibacteria bacterium]|nr:hypothetical protein [Ignavibacteria bacterium]
MKSYKNFLLDKIFELQKNIKADGVIEKEIEIIFSYFSFERERYPTYQNIAERFKNTKQNVEQKIKKFVSGFTEEDIKYFNDIKNRISKRYIYFLNDMDKVLLKEDIILGDISFSGLINMFKSLDISYEYTLLNDSLKEATRDEIIAGKDIILVRNDVKNEIRKFLKKIFDAPGQNGIACLNDYYESVEKYLNKEDLDRIVSRKNESWKYYDDDKIWFLFENKENSIINNLKKVKTVVPNSQIKIEILADNFERFQKNRKKKDITTPSKHIIGEYLKKSSKYIYSVNEYVTIKDNLENAELKDMDDILNIYFKKNDYKHCNATELKDEFERNNLTEAAANKAIYNSPFIYINKGNGRKNYIFHHIKEFSNNENEYPQKNRYQVYKEKLFQFINNTDYDVITKQRREQEILREYLFEGKNYETCAICGKNYQVSGLVTAHKKKRAICSENERTDPDIVMPLCKFGCDYLYEEGIITIKNSIVNISPDENNTKHEIEYLKSIDGKKLDEKWLENSGHYFA